VRRDRDTFSAGDLIDFAIMCMQPDAIPEA
jgi:hypothetical protein